MEAVRLQLLTTTALTDKLLSELWDFTCRFVETDRQEWARKLAGHDEVILFRGRRSGTLVGMGAVDFRDIAQEERRVHVIFTSSVLIDERYRLFDTFSYKSYLLLARNFVEFWPRPGRTMPPWERGLMEALARREYGEAWDSTPRRTPRPLPSSIPPMTGEARPGAVEG